MDIKAVRQAIANAVKAAVPNINTHGYVPDSVSVPCFYVGGLQVNYDMTMGRGSDEINLTCSILVSASNDASGQAQLDDFLKGGGPGSLKAAIEADETLGGTCDSVTVSNGGNYSYRTHGSTEYLGADLTVNVSGMVPDD